MRASAPAIPIEEKSDAADRCQGLLVHTRVYTDPMTGMPAYHQSYTQCSAQLSAADGWHKCGCEVRLCMDCAKWQPPNIGCRGCMRVSLQSDVEHWFLSCGIAAGVGASSRRQCSADSATGSLSATSSA